MIDGMGQKCKDDKKPERAAETMRFLFASQSALKESQALGRKCRIGTDIGRIE